MQIIADLHIHSAFAQGSHRELHVETIALWAKRKGIHVVGTGDWTHPAWCSELRAKLVPAEDGLFQLRPDLLQQVHQQLPSSLHPQTLRFLLSTEVSTVFEQDNRVHKLHHLLFAPDFARVQRIRQYLERFGDLALDGRPTLSLSAHDLLDIVLQTSPRTHLIPAHVWNPYNGLFGSHYGFNTLTEGYGDLQHHVFALETGLSSIPPMIRRCSSLDSLTLVSFSNAHSPDQIGREATVFSTSLSYDAIFEALSSRHRNSPPLADITHTAPSVHTLECYPERGRYFLDGHRSCQIKFTPEQTREHSLRCPVCRKPLTIGVLHRIEQLADRSTSEGLEQTHESYTNILSLPEILSDILELPLSSKRLQQQYLTLIENIGSELYILREAPLETIRHSQIPLLSEAIHRVRTGQIQCTPGYDGEFGKIHIFQAGESKSTTLSLFDWSPPFSDTNPLLTRISKTSEQPKPPLVGQQLHLFSQDPVPSPATDSAPFLAMESSQPLAIESSRHETSRPPDQNTTHEHMVPSVLSANTTQEVSSPHTHNITEDAVTAAISPELTEEPNEEPSKPSEISLDPGLQTGQEPPLQHLHIPAKDVLSGLNTEQRAVVLHRGGPLQIMAGPGTGKTKTLLHRLADQLIRKTVQPEHAVMFTFTQEAAQRCQYDLAQLVGALAQRAFIGTFHRFCLHLLQNIRSEMLAASHSSDSALIPPHLPTSLLSVFERLALLENLANTLHITGSPRRLRYVMDRISWAKQNLLSPDDIAENYHPIEQDFLQLYRSYQRYLTQHHLYDLDDLVFETVHYLRQSPDHCQRLQLHYRSFFIDEYQELNEAQYRLLRFLVSDYADLCVAGDPDQHIYSFCGSHRQYFYQFVHDFSPPHHKALKTALWRNYRSPEAVLEAAHLLIQKQHDPQRVQPLATQTGLLFLPTSLFSNEHEEASAIALQILDMVKPIATAALPQPSLLPLANLRTSEHYHVPNFQDIAIVYRSSQQVAPLEQALQQAGIPYQLTRSDSVTSHKDILLEHVPSPLPLASHHISLLPMRACKGREFPVVIIPGCEDALLPWQETHTDPDALSEERRLFYVALTRCSQLAWLTLTRQRHVFDQPQPMTPSRFLKELDGFLYWTSSPAPHV